jgi:iron complex outermembrane receptor protein
MKKKQFSLKKVMGVMAVAFFGFSLSVVGQTDSLKNVQLSEVQVIAQRQQVYSDMARVVSVVSKAEIASAPVTTLSDLLRYVQGVDIRQRGANGVQADISVRGGTFDQVLILLNGVNITDPQTGHHNLNLPIDLSVIERIEILQGPGSRVLGPNAFSGAINIITGNADKNAVHVNLSAGDYGYISQAADATVKSGGLTSFASFSHSRSEGYKENTDFDMTNAFLQLRYDSKLFGALNLQSGYQDKGFGAYGFYSAAYPDEYEQTRTFFASLSSEKKIGNFTLLPKIYWRQHHDRFELFRAFENAPIWYTQHNYHQTDVVGATLTGSYLSAWGKTSTGIDFRSEHIYSNALGEFMTTTVQAPFAENGINFTKEKSRENLNGFIEHAIFLDKFSASVGVLGNYSNDFGFNTYFGGDMGYAFSSSLKAFASVNQSLRLPTFTDLYTSNSALQGSPDLKPETALTYELGLKYTTRFVNAGLSGYYRQGRNVIDWIKTPDEIKFKSVNHAQVDALGGEAFAEYAPMQFLQRVKLSYSYLWLDKATDEYVSKYALDYLRQKVALTLDHNIYKGFSASWRASWQERNGTYVEPITNVVKNYEPFFLTDLRVQWANKNIKVYVECTNLFDSHYWDYGGIEQPGRWVRTGIIVKL